MNKIVRSVLTWSLIGIIVFMIYRLYETQQDPIKEISYTQFLDQLGKEAVDCNVSKVTFSEKEIVGIFREAVLFEDDNQLYSRFRTRFPFEDPQLIWYLRERNVDVESRQLQRWYTLVGPMIPVVLLIVFLYFFIYRQVQVGGNRALAFGKSRAKLVVHDRPRITFANVAGADEPKQELQEVVEFLKEPKKFTKLGAKIPKGVLLYGPPGCGKTLLAKAVAGEAEVPFYSISGSDFVEMFVGVGASRVRDLFEQGRKSAVSSNRGCIIFIDEIDAVGRQRFAGIGGGHDEREQTLNQLLAEMDGFDTKEGVILLAATNRPDVLDAALLRPGRFDRQIEVYSPDLAGREGILRVHTRNVVLGKDADMNGIARGTPGFSGADLANLVNEAALLAARRNKKSVGMKELEEARERIIAGPERKSRVINDYEKSIVSYHESGHALLALLIPEADPLHKVSIIPRGGAALGYTLQLPLEDRYLTTKKELLGRMTVFLGGRVAEELVFNESTTGAQNDLEMVSQAARRMVCEFGMSEKLGPITFRERPEKIFLGRDITKEKMYSEKVAFDIDNEVRRIIDLCHQRARSLLEQNQERLGKLAAKLKEKEVLHGKEVEEIVGLSTVKQSEDNLREETS